MQFINLFVVGLFLIEAVSWAVWVTRAPVFLKGQDEPLVGAELLPKEGEEQGVDQVEMRRNHERCGSGRRVKKAGPQPRKNS